jgi:hypothetical protein
VSPLSFCRVGTRGGLSALRLNIPEAMQCAARDPAMPLVPFVACPCMLYVYHLCLGSRCLPGAFGFAWPWGGERMVDVRLSAVRAYGARE